MAPHEAEDHMRLTAAQEAPDLTLLSDLIPVGILVIDGSGLIRHANARAASMTGYDQAEVIGRPVVEFIDESDLEFMATALVEGMHYRDALLGPLRIRYRHADGSLHLTESWAHASPPELGIEGFVVAISTESVTDNVADAVYEIASGEPLDHCLATLARAVSGYPLVALGSVLIVEGERFRPVGAWPFLSPDGGAAFLDAATTPWHDVLLSGKQVEVDIDQLPSEIADAATELGFQSVWVRPVVTHDGDLAAVFVAWRREPGFTSGNQDRHLGEVIAAAGLAVDSARHRAALERAALFDPLTGLGNRTALAGHLKQLESVAPAVLYVDLDGFKQVNDRYGHDTGDQVLAVAARRLLSAIRDDDRVFRVGGDEFVIVCDGLPADEIQAATEALASRVVATLAEPIRVGDVMVRIGASVGIAQRLPGEGTAQVIRRADAALLLAKASGKARWHRAVSGQNR
jgi:diguanylate cyclase (GGDEF)-like protein/PAS domain S-box-containing protein